MHVVGRWIGISSQEYEWGEERCRYRKIIRQIDLKIGIQTGGQKVRQLDRQTNE
jgi:hypothetical protein